MYRRKHTVKGMISCLERVGVPHFNFVSVIGTRGATALVWLNTKGRRKSTLLLQPISSLRWSKLIAAAVTGSSAMFSEGIHSTADAGNQLLMLLGIKRSRKPADSKHPFGNGQEVYFWGFVVAMLLFSVGGVVSVYEGIRRLKYPEALSDPLWNYIVLAIAAASESTSLWESFDSRYDRVSIGGTRCVPVKIRACSWSLLRTRWRWLALVSHSSESYWNR